MSRNLTNPRPVAVATCRPVLFILLSIGLCCCRQAAREPDWGYVHTFGMPDSMRHAIEAGVFEPPEEMVANGVLGMAYFTMGKFDSARIYLHRSLEMPGGREYQGGRFIANLANTYAFEGRYSEAMTHYMESLEIAERQVATGGNVVAGEENIVRVGANLGEILYTIGNHERALHYALMANDLLERGRIRSVSYIHPQALYVLGAVYLERGELDMADSLLLKTFDVAAEIAQMHLVIGDQHAGGQWWYHAYAREGQAHVAMARGETERALALATDALRYAEKHGDPTVTARMEAAISDVHHARGNHALSGEWAARALATYPEHPKLNPDVLFNAAAAHLHAGDSDEAYEDFTAYAAQMRANTEKQFRETMAGMEVVYETEKSEARISTLEKQRRLYALTGVAGGLFLLAMCVVFYQRIRHERQDKKLVAASAVIEWEKRERKRFAGDLHDGINGMLSAIKLQLASAGDPHAVAARLDECIDTIRRMARGMMPSSLERYGLRAALEDYCRLFPGVRFHFYGEERRLGEKLELTLYYCAHELVGNSFRHSGATVIDLQLVMDVAHVSLTVHDNGRGFDTAAAHDGSGLQNLRDRVASVNGVIDIESHPGLGSETNIEINT